MKIASRLVAGGFLLFARCLFPDDLIAGINTWTTTGPEGGRVTQIVVDPINPSRIYTITPYGGIFKTTDAGMNWRAANRGNTSFTALRLAIDPTTPTTLYVAAYNGVFKTTDSAESWHLAGTGLSEVVVWTVTIDPSNPQRLYAGTERNGVYRSTDGGAIWLPPSEESTLSVGAIAVDPKSPATLYAAALTGIFKSVDAGVSWSPSGGITSPARRVAVDPRESTTVYAGTETGGVFKSVDGGLSWQPASNGLPVDSYVSDLAIDPRNSDRLLAGVTTASIGDAIFTTTDRAASWTPLTVGTTGIGTAVSFDPTTSTTLYAGVSRSAFRGTFLKSTDAGQSWMELNRGRSGSLVTAVATDPFEPGIAYASAFLRIYKTTDYAETWMLASTLSAGVNVFVFDPSRRGILYAATGAGVFKSIDGGAQWTSANEGLTNLQVWSLGIDRRGRTLYAGTSEGVFRSDDGATTWNATAPLPDPFPIVWTLAVDPVHWKTAYARSGNALAKTTDGGGHWTILEAAPRYVTALAIDPTNPEIVVAAGEFETLKTVDGGHTWMSASNGLPYPAVLGPRLAMDPSRPSTLYFSQWVGAFRTSDRGELWTAFSDGLLWGAQVFGLAVNSTGDTVYAATYGGVYSYRIRASSFYTLSPCRVADTRTPSNAPPLNAESERTFSISGSCGVPPTARAVALNTTVAEAASEGYLSVFETGIPTPDVISIAYRAGQTRANNAIVTLDPLGRLTVRCNQPSGTVHVILDVTGYFQ